jgi:formylglycine-generating enzyme required for sulfatase activity
MTRWIAFLMLALAGLAANAAFAQGSAPASARTIKDCADCPELVVIPAGSFTMGSPADEPEHEADESPQRPIRIVRPFAVARSEVTRAQYAAFAHATRRPVAGGCLSDRDRDGRMQPDPASSWRDPGFDQEGSHPVTCVTWDDARAYVAWLNATTGSNAYRLLTDAEWEYAARAGTVTAFPWGTAASRDFANYGADTCCAPAASGRDQWLYTAPAGSFPANGFGLVDMHGNVGEWVQDCFVRSLEQVPGDGSAYEAGGCENRVIRNAGGSFGGRPGWVRSANRSGDPAATFRNTNVGFRVAKTL